MNALLTQKTGQSLARVALVFLLAACTSDDTIEGSTPVQGDAIITREDVQWVRGIGDVPPGQVWIIGTLFNVKTDITLQRAALLRPSSEAVVVRDVRMTDLSDGGGLTVGGPCHGSWPPPGLGPTVDVEGFHASPGRIYSFSVVFFFEAVEEDPHWTADGIVLDYLQDGMLKRQVLDSDGFDARISAGAEMCYWPEPDVWWTLAPG